jgi:o-succinylbenzoate synthase
MRIDRITLTHVRVPLVEPFRISSGAVAEKDGIVVAVEAGGITGYGESSPMAGSFYSTDTPESCWRDLCEVVAPAALAEERETIEDWNCWLDPLACGNFSKTGFETALWDLEARRRGVPLYRLLGGERNEVESGLAVGLYDSIDDTLRAVERYMSDGYRRVKLKIERGHDVEIIAAARRAFGNIPLFVDANGAYSLEDLDVFRRLDEFGLMMYEQPFPGPALEDLAELQARVTTPICLDESLESVELFERAAALGSLKIANIKIQRVGGLYHARRLHDAAQARGIPCWMGTMPELGIGCAQGAHLASLANCRFPTDVEASLRWFRDDIVEPLIEVIGGVIRLPESPGLGWEPAMEKLEKYCVAHKAFAA